MDAEEVLAQLDAGVLGDAAEYLDESAGRTLLLRGSGRICKIFLSRPDDRDRADREIAALRILADSDVPAPALIDHGSLPGGERWVLMSELPGVPLTIRDYESPEGLEFQRFRGRVMAIVHGSVHPPAFGLWTRNPQRSLADSAAGDSVRLAASAAAVRPERADICRRLRLLQESLLEALQVGSVRVGSDLTGDLTGSVPGAAPVLVHGDPGPANFLLDPPGLGGKLVGVLDWETATGSIPAAEFAGPALFSAPGLAAFAAGYAQVGDLDQVTPERLGYFVIDRILQVFGTTGGRWNPGLDGIAESMAFRLLSGDFSSMVL